MGDNADCDVDLLLKLEPLDALELIAENPAYYLSLIENYTVLPDGSPIYLPCALNINVQRTYGKVSIKFKLSPTSRWYEVGYEDGDEEAAYKAFTKKVTYLLRYPPEERGHLVEASLVEPATNEALPVEALPVEDMAINPSPVKILPSEDSDEPSPIDVLSETAYTIQSMELLPLCPEKHLAAYTELIELWNTSEPFIKAQLKLLPISTPAQQICMLHFLKTLV